MALANFFNQEKILYHVGNMNTFGGADINSSARQASQLLDNIARYDELLKEFEGLRNHRAAPATLARKQLELKRAYTKMNNALNQKGRKTLSKYAVKTREVVNQTGRVVRESIPISSQADVQSLSKLVKGARILGPGVILLDGSLRYNKVTQMYRDNHPKWEREAVVQASGFAMGIATAGMITFSITPFGFVVGLIVAGGMAIAADSLAQGVAGQIYDGVTR